jgi:SNF2 family DNA or RNA helicase
MKKIPPPFKHQKQSKTFLRKTDRAFDMSDPGTGKTRAHAEDFAERREKGGGCGLVFGPKSILQAAWGNDIDQFVPHLKYVIATAENRKDAFDEQADLYITNIDAATWLAQQKPAFFKRFSHLIIDESTAFKHHTSQRSKAMDKIKKYFPVRRNLSGSPNPNGMSDLWHQVKLLDDGKRLGPSFFAYRAAICTPVQTGPMPNHVRWEDREGAEIAVMGLLKDITIRHVLEECLDMPENVMYPMQYRLPSKHLAHYLKMEADAIMMIRDKKVSAVNGAVLYGKLLQIASGAVYDDEGKYVVVDHGRYELIADMVEQRRHSLVFFQWAHQRDELIKEFEKRGITFSVIDGESTTRDREEFVEYFQKGFYRVGLLHPKSAGHGLTLTRATSSIWASPTVNAEWWVQANRRAYRAGQTQRTETIVVVAQNTVDERVFASCMNKDVKMSALLRELAL